MNKKEIYFQSLKSVAVSLMVAIVLTGFSNVSEAKSNMVSVDGVNYSTNSTLSDNIKTLKGKKITVMLKSGKSISGTVKAVGNHLLHLEKLEGKEFFDALIEVDDISAIETRFRMIKR